MGLTDRNEAKSFEEMAANEEKVVQNESTEETTEPLSAPFGVMRGKGSQPIFFPV